MLSDPQLLMDLRGNWQTGGVLEVFLPGDEEPVEMELAPAPWGVLALLFCSRFGPNIGSMPT